VERGIPRGIKREQAVVDDEAVRSAITEQCIRQEPTAAAACYSQKDWELNFEQRWILQDERYMRSSTEIAGSGGAIYCRTCVEPRKHGKLAAYRMHVTIGDDPMKVAKHGIIQLECHGCGFEQVVHRKPKVSGGVFGFDEASKIDPRAMSALEQQIKIREAQQRMGKSVLGAGYYDPRMAAQGIGGSYANELESLRAAYQNKMISPQEFKEHAQHLMEDAARRVNMAANPPMLSIGKPPKGPFDPP
jgi:hypothetical protein